MEMFEDKLDKQMKEAYRKIREDLKDQEAGSCLDEETLICYLEKKLAEPEVEEIEKHLPLLVAFARSLAVIREPQLRGCHDLNPKTLFLAKRAGF